MNNCERVIATYTRGDDGLAVRTFMRSKCNACAYCTPEPEQDDDDVPRDRAETETVTATYRRPGTAELPALCERAGGE